MSLTDELIECSNTFILLNYLVSFLPQAIILRGSHKMTENLRLSRELRGTCSDTFFLFTSVLVHVSDVVPSQEKLVCYFAVLAG